MSSSVPVEFTSFNTTCAGGSAAAFDVKTSVRNWAPSPELQGRFGAVRVKTKQVDVTIISVYFPTWDRAARSVKKVRATAQALLKQVSRVVDELPARSLVVMGADLNDDFDLPSEEEEETMQAIGGATVADYEATLGLAGAQDSHGGPPKMTAVKPDRITASQKNTLAGTIKSS